MQVLAENSAHAKVSRRGVEGPGEVPSPASEREVDILAVEWKDSVHTKSQKQKNG